MKLSEAIRLGAMMKPQGFFEVFDGARTCAAGAAMDALGVLRADGIILENFRTLALRLGWDIDRMQLAPCPDCGDAQPMNRAHTIPHLNDDHRWTRERIADWVETLELVEQPAPSVHEER